VKPPATAATLCPGFATSDITDDAALVGTVMLYLHLKHPFQRVTLERRMSSRQAGEWQFAVFSGDDNRLPVAIGHGASPTKAIIEGMTILNARGVKR